MDEPQHHADKGDKTTLIVKQAIQTIGDAGENCDLLKTLTSETVSEIVEPLNEFRREGKDSLSLSQRKCNRDKK
jgi:hypothetical protein